MRWEEGRIRNTGNQNTEAPMTKAFKEAICRTRLRPGASRYLPWPAHDICTLVGAARWRGSAENGERQALGYKMGLIIGARHTICVEARFVRPCASRCAAWIEEMPAGITRSEEHTSELQSPMYLV